MSKKWVSTLVFPSSPFSLASFRERMEAVEEPVSPASLARQPHLSLFPSSHPQFLMVFTPAVCVPSAWKTTRIP